MEVLLQALLHETLFVNFSLGILSVIVVGLLSWVLARIIGLSDLINTESSNSKDRSHDIENKLTAVQKDIGFLSDNLPDTKEIFSKILDLEYRQARMERAILRINCCSNSPEADLYTTEDESKE